MTKIELGKIKIENKKDVADIMRLIKEGVKSTSLNDNQSRLVDEGLDKIESTCINLFEEVGRIEEIKKKADKCDKIIEILTLSQTKKLLKEGF